jgi:Xaa-Pro aminopeptidase
LLIFGYALYSPGQGGYSSFEAVVWSSYDHSALNDVPQIAHAEFVDRQKELASRIAEEKVDAFIAESGGTTQYYANFSYTDWGLSERPFLLVVTPDEMFFLAPLFEVSRARMLSIPSSHAITFITWAEGLFL